MSECVLKGGTVMDRKTVSISSKRQITIPQKFFSMLGFNTEAECVIRGNELVIRPVKNMSGGEFSEQILADLISHGFSGNELLTKFKEEQKKVSPAVKAMMADAENAASGTGKYASYDDVFGSEE